MQHPKVWEFHRALGNLDLDEDLHEGVLAAYYVGIGGMNLDSA